MGQKIVSKPFSRDGLSNFDKIFRKTSYRPMEGEKDRGTLGNGVRYNNEREDENVDWGEIKTIICCTDDPHFGG